MILRLFYMSFFALLGVTPLSAQQLAEKILPLNGQIAADGTEVQIDWFDTPRARIGAATVYRRELGEIGQSTWTQIGPIVSAGFQYTDQTTQEGIAYEYQVIREGRDIIDVGYWTTGVSIPAQDKRGHAYLLVDETLVDDLKDHLDRFQRDLLGDGWDPIRLNVPRHDTTGELENLRKAAAIKAWLIARHAEDPDGQHAIILIGHVPILKSGQANPDGHGVEPQTTDLLYADVDGQWQVNEDAKVLNNGIPGDFIEMQIGRIDFEPVSNGDREQELHLLRAYFDKNHHWRGGYHGDLREGYGKFPLLAVELAGLRNVVGPELVTAGGHHDVGEEKPWLWGVDFGDWNGGIYAEKYANKAVFTINFGSAKQKIDARNNGLTAMLAQPWYPISSGWGARPSWWLHHMSLGGSIGDAHMRTVNNGKAAEPYRESMDYFPTGQYLWRNPVWVNLLGDPTARAFALAPVSQLKAQEEDGGVYLTWSPSADPDMLGYRVYRAEFGSADFLPLDGGDIVSGTAFFDPVASEGATYMVRAYGLKTVYAGSFFTLSQGVFTEGGNPFSVPEIALTATAGEPIDLPQSFNAPAEGVIRAFVSGAPIGDISFDEGAWRYTPPAGFNGEVDLRFTASNDLQTVESQLKIIVKP